MPKVCIIGGGPIGCALGTTLRSHNYSVDIYERYPDIRSHRAPAGRSINLVLTRRGLRLAESLEYGSELVKETVKVSGRNMHMMDRSSLYQPYGRDGECNYSISRTQLNKFWLEKAEAKGCRMFFDYIFKFIDHDTHHIQFETGSSIIERVPMQQYDVIFASDGGGSLVRQSLRNFGYLDATESLLSSAYKEVTFPATASGEYPMDPNSLHIWARHNHMLMALANTDGSFTGTLYMEIQGTESFESECENSESAKQFFVKYYSDALDLMNESDAINNLVNFKQGILGTVRCSPWAVKMGPTRICLIGDAAHAIVPFHGQGVNLGFEDVYVLDQLIRSSSLLEAVEEFSRTRKRDSDAIADMALENFDEMRSKVAISDFQFRKKLDAFIMNAFPSKYRTRYTLVMYSFNSYSSCKKLGEIQNEFLSDVIAKFSLSETSDLEKSIDKDLLSSMIDSMITPLAKSLDISFEF